MKNKLVAWGIGSALVGVFSFATPVAPAEAAPVHSAKVTGVAVAEHADGSLYAARDRAQEREFEKAMEILASGDDERIAAALVEGENETCGTQGQTRAIPIIIGAAAIVYCVYNAQDVIRNQHWTKSNAIGKLADIITSCVPAGGSAKAVAKLIWKYRKQVAAALSSISLAASQAILGAPQPR